MNNTTFYAPSMPEQQKALQALADLQKRREDLEQQAKLNGWHAPEQIAPPAILQKYHFEDWDDIFNSIPDEVQWLREPVLEAGTLNVIYGERGKGKSLFVLENAAILATSGKVVLYIDQENRKVEYRDRLRDMGYLPADLKKNLHLLLFSDLPPLDTEEGGKDLLDLVNAIHCDLVIIDTRSRFARGRENDSDTFINMYNMSLRPLKRENITVIMLDHSGKNRDLGPRGSSAKGGDIDTEWEITAPKDSKFRYLECKKCRAGRVEEGFKITLEKIKEPVFSHRWIWDYTQLTHSGEEGAVCGDREDYLSEALDKLEVPKNAGRPAAEKALVNAGIRFDTHVLAEVIRVRKAVCHTATHSSTQPGLG